MLSSFFLVRAKIRDRDVILFCDVIVVERLPSFAEPKFVLYHRTK